MTTNSSANFLTLWEEMAQAKTGGMIKRMIPSGAPIRAFGIYSYPENTFGVAFSYDDKIKISIELFKNLKELDVRLLSDTTFKSHNLLIIQILSVVNREVFAHLCDNLVHSIEEVATEREAVRKVVDRLTKWKTLFDKGQIDGLSLSAQQGLYGELDYLRKLLNSHIFPNADAIKFWVGPVMAMRDFQGDGWAVEVKTCSVNNAERITINGKRQLDETPLKSLFLYHLSLETSPANGDTLNVMVDNVRRLLEDDAEALYIFNGKLVEVGYFDAHRNMYEERCYMVRAIQFYRVSDNFPRIREQELRGGIEDVTYVINTTACGEYLLSEGEHFNIIKNQKHE